MIQYCRYCSNCVAQDEDNAICTEKNEFVTKKTIRNSCKTFDFCEIDAFYFNRTDNPDNARYKPKEPKMKQCAGQLSLFPVSTE